ncbi:MAG: hypothetical protein FJ087_15885, partial [Deltaproteobacteria bacterium]|nr:hypothetical protein [Deltaproteobacteria bacterium]
MGNTSLIKLLVPLCGALVFAVTAGNEKGGCTPTPPDEIPVDCTTAADCDGLPHDDCLGGWQCAAGECGWKCDGPQDLCVASGCSGEVCATEPVFTPCIWKEEFECLKLTKCGSLADGSCGFDPNPEYLACLAKFNGCKTDAECNGFKCVDGKCVDVPPPPECGPDLPCPAGYQCVETADCPPCVYEPPYCKIACKVKYVCEPVEAGCRSDLDCPPEQHCSVSDGECLQDPTCPMCDVCFGKCVDDPVGCTDDSQCPEGYYCLMDYSNCGGGTDPASGDKRDPGAEAPVWCGGTGTCVKKEDPYKCWSDADCPAGWVCQWENACPPCDCDTATGDCACPGCLVALPGTCVPGGCTDMDGDGWCAGEDCDDYNPATSPGAVEICDDWVDNNCNGLVDEDCGQTPQCWSDADCQWWEYCSLPYAYEDTGVIACCPANAKCTPDVPPCGAGVCMMTPGYCWNDKDCGYGESCEGAIPACECPPGALCKCAPPQPGKCVFTGPTCTPVKPGSHGYCKMLLGWIFDGKSCVVEGGCSCEPDCGAFFGSQEECEKACGIANPGCTSNAECAKGEYCDFSASDLSACCMPGQMCIMIYPPCEGTCKPLAPPCASNAECGIGESCVNGMCVMKEGLCWDDTYCKPGYHCEGAIICPPGAYCFVADQPGKCVPDTQPTCVAVKPYSHGMCEMFLGFIFDGSKCVGESGCGCGYDCGFFFQTQEECE